MSHPDRLPAASGRFPRSAGRARQSLTISETEAAYILPRAAGAADRAEAGQAGGAGGVANGGRLALDWDNLLVRRPDAAGRGGMGPASPQPALQHGSQRLAPVRRLRRWRQRRQPHMTPKGRGTAARPKP